MRGARYVRLIPWTLRSGSQQVERIDRNAEIDEGGRRGLELNSRKQG
jgi:hypothetical protein